MWFLICLTAFRKIKIPLENGDLRALREINCFKIEGVQSIKIGICEKVKYDLIQFRKF